MICIVVHLPSNIWNYFYTVCHSVSVCHILQTTNDRVIQSKQVFMVYHSNIRRQFSSCNKNPFFLLEVHIIPTLSNKIICFSGIRSYFKKGNKDIRKFMASGKVSVYNRIYFCQICWNICTKYFFVEIYFISFL